MSNRYFNNFNSEADQKLIDDLTVEAIQQYGVDAYYLIRSDQVFDEVYTEGPAPAFNEAMLTCFFVQSFDGFRGQGDLLSKFGLEIRDQITFTVARRTFTYDIPSLARPREGDLIFFPFNQKLFEIKFVEHEAVFYQLGSLQSWDIRCELIEYTNQIISTGIPAIDERYDSITFNRIEWALTDETGVILVTEGGKIITVESVDQDISDRDYKEPDQREIFEEKKTDLLDFTEHDPFSER